MKDIIIIGSGPAGYTAGIYGARAGRECTIIEGLQPGGQLMITTDIENFPGFEEPIPGPDLMARMRAQAERVGVELVSDIVESVDFGSTPYKVNTGSEQREAKTVVIATGAEAKWLEIPSEQAFKGRGVSACATCDGFFFRGKKVAIVGGGDTACEEALYLTNHASEVVLIHRRDQLRASKIMADRTLSNDKISPLWYRVVDEVVGDESGVTGLRLKDPRNAETEEIPVDGLFIAIGHQPNTAFLNGQLELNDTGYIKTEPGTTRTSVEGVFAAGDVQDSVYRQAVTAAGTGCMAAIEASRLLESAE